MNYKPKAIKSITFSRLKLPISENIVFMKFVHLCPECGDIFIYMRKRTEVGREATPKRLPNEK